MKIIVTHFAPDVDAVTSVWLIKNFLPGWGEAQVEFVPAGKTLNDEIVDSDPDVLHVDTGMGMLDHHQSDENTCAAKRTFEYISGILDKSKNIKKKDFNPEALERIIEVVNDIDHFREVYFPNPNADFYDLGLTSMMDGWKLLYPEDNLKLIDFGMNVLDAIYKSFQNKVWAEEEIKETAVIFQTKWGKALGIETVNDEVVRVAQKIGYVLAVRKDPNKKYVRIKALPDTDINLTECYNKLKKMDTDATWFLHVSKKMILNGSLKNPETKSTNLSLKEIIDVLKLG